jgi:hypothetical protein
MVFNVEGRISSDMLSREMSCSSSSRQWLYLSTSHLSKVGDYGEVGIDSQMERRQDRQQPHFALVLLGLDLLASRTAQTDIEFIAMNGC